MFVCFFFIDLHGPWAGRMIGGGPELKLRGGQALFSFFFGKIPKRYLALNGYNQVLGVANWSCCRPNISTRGQGKKERMRWEIMLPCNFQDKFSQNYTSGIISKKKALEMAEIRQTRQIKSFAPLLFHESNFPKYLNISALSRYTLKTMFPKRRPRI